MAPAAPARRLQRFALRLYIWRMFHFSDISPAMGVKRRPKNPTKEAGDAFFAALDPRSD
jgi:hypothetical protein